MILLDKHADCTEPRHHSRPLRRLPQTRRSILDPCLENEPWLDLCPCTQLLFLFLHNHPIAAIPGTSLDSISMTMRLNQLRHRNPRQS